jgi:hypothetical protein
MAKSSSSAAAGGSPKTVQRRFTATPMVQAYISDIVKTGLFGNKPSEVTARLVAMSIARLIQEGAITRRTVPPTSEDIGEEEE